MENDRTDIEFTQEDFHENHKISSIKYQTEWTMTNFEPNIWPEIVTWNVKTMYDDQKMEQVMTAMQRCRLEVCRAGRSGFGHFLSML
jgi:hypothetical protein